MNGYNVKFAIGGGAAEDGSGTLFTYFMDELSKTNETGYPTYTLLLSFCLFHYTIYHLKIKSFFID